MGPLEQEAVNNKLIPTASEILRSTFSYDYDDEMEVRATWEVGHTQFVTSQLLHIRSQPDIV